MDEQSVLAIVSVTHGNCLVGAFLLMVRHRTWQIRALWTPPTSWKRLGRAARFVPHFYVVAADGTCWHFKTVKDVLPFPLCLLWFEGRFQEF